jgi:hypothetical protein
VFTIQLIVICLHHLRLGASPIRLNGDRFSGLLLLIQNQL